MAKADISLIFKTHSGRQKPRQRREKIKQEKIDRENQKASAEHSCLGIVITDRPSRCLAEVFMDPWSKNKVVTSRFWS